jgi:hypothetical protein
MPPAHCRISKLALTTLQAVCHAALLGSLLASMLLLPGLPIAAKALEPQVRYPATLELIGKFGTRIIGEGRAFLPLWQNPDNLLYLDLRGMGDDSSNAEGNGGVAYRHLFGESWILGAYGFFDYRSTNFGDNSFVGGTLGLEALSTNWDFHLNGYIPESDSKSAPAADRVVATFPTIGVQRGREKALWGFDSEIGWRLPFSDDSLFWDTRIYAGGYYFDNSGVKEITGPRGRLEMRFHDPFPFLPRGSRITLGGEVQWDDPRGTQGYGSVALRVPIYSYGGTPPDGSTQLSRLQRRMLDPIQRDVDIITNVAAGGIEPVFNPKTAERIDFLYYADAETNGAGSLSDPAAISDAIDFAGPNGIVVAVDQTGAIDTDNAFLEDSQILMGGGGTILVNDISGQAFPFTAQGGRATLVNPGGIIVTAARNNLIDGLDFGIEGFGGEGGLSDIGIFAGEPGASPIPGVFGGLMVTDSTFTGINLSGIQVFTIAPAGEGNGPSQLQVGIMRNTFDGDFLGLGLFASADQVLFDISDNDFLVEEGSDQAVQLISAGPDNNVLFANNRVEGFTGSCPEDEDCSAAVAISGAGLSTLEVSNNTIRAPLDSEDAVRDGFVGLSVLGTGEAVDVNIASNRLDGFTGQAANLSDNFPLGPITNAVDLLGAGAALQVTVDSDLAGVAVTGNRITGPRLGDSDPFFAAAGLGVSVAANGGLEPPNGDNGNEGFPGAGDGETSQADVLVANNRVRDYTGLSQVFEDGEFSAGAVAAVEVETFGPLNLDVTGNQILAREFVSGADPENLSNPRGPGLVVEANQLGSNRLNVSDNRVEDFATVQFFDANGDPVGGVPAAVEISATTGGFDAIDLSVSGNRIHSTEFPGGRGMRVDLNAFAVGMEDEHAMVAGNRIEGYLGLPQPIPDEGGDAVTQGVSQIDGVGAALEIVASTAFTFLDVSDNRVSGFQQNTEDGQQRIGGSAVYIGTDGGNVVNVSVQNNDLDGFYGLAEIGYDTGAASTAANAALRVSSTNADAVDITIQDNRVAAAPISALDGISGDPPGASGVGINVTSTANSDIRVDVSSNDVDGYAADVGPPGLLAPNGAIVVSTFTNSAGTSENFVTSRVTVAGNDVTAPDLEGEPSQAGISVVARDNIFGPTRLFTQALVDVSDNDVDGYTGTSAVAAVQVSSQAYLVLDGNNPGTLVENNRVSAPDSGGVTGIDVDADGFFVSVDVADNDVDGYASAGVLAGSEGEDGVNGAGIRVNANASFPDSNQAQATVRVADNEVRAPQDAGSGDVEACGNTIQGPLGIEVCNSSNVGSTIVSGNQVFDYESGIFVQAVQDTVDIEVTTNQVDAVAGSSGRGIAVANVFGQVATISIEDNQVSGGSVGVSGTAWGTAARNTLDIANNRIQDTQAFGIQASTLGTTDATIAGNDIDVEDEAGAKGIMLGVAIGTLDVDSVLDGDPLDNSVAVSQDGDELEVNDSAGVVSGEILINGVLICLPDGLPCE